MKKLALFCVFSNLIVQITLSDHDARVLRFQKNDSITLNCSFTDMNEIAWYHQSPKSGRLKLLIFATAYFILQADQDSRITFKADRGSKRVWLVITGLTESDTGLYFCGSKNFPSEMHFQKPIRIQMEEQQTDSEDEAPDEEVTDGLTLTERVMVFGGAGLALLLFSLVTVFAGRSIYYHGWQKGWIAAEHTGLTPQKPPIFHTNTQITSIEADYVNSSSLEEH